MFKMARRIQPASTFRKCSSLAFVPRHSQSRNEDIEKLTEFLTKYNNIFLLTGAGISTESGIPDYRSEGVGLYATSTKRPIQHKVFMESSKARQSYWARNYIGWPRWSNFQPNINHLTLARWEATGRISHLVTQNVDQLHLKAGSRDITELHGTNSVVTCMSCSHRMPRMLFQQILSEANPSMIPRCAEIRPDGDVELSAEEVTNFRVPDCPKCGGILKPFVVFFGDNVPRPRVDQVRKKLSNSDSMLVIGSSLYVFSAFRKSVVKCNPTIYSIYFTM
ncbi:NAD-dependent protein deacylase Sirt4-like [Eurytemora carolleeae]|uniref:NAD-dependent protein deacylase Sirt4-like n=1 Tax=Eurytemora carolleeae TaxID=1294199 RepID=UPI000C7878DE|nr:NAD-dependent protein deacylase Sirt4-like [Eurytemora carolleeae]|eukprot:XP_023336953.1 NAD-dependent protein deacylase Sirt4-like [Eurytemora affinis]